MATSRIQFVKWWLMTEFGGKKELQKSIRWDTIQKKSDVWSSFDQVANARTGEPKPRQSTSTEFSQTTLQKKILKFITTTRLPFRTVEHPEFKELLQYTRLATSELNIPSARSLRRLLDNEVQEQQQSVLSKLPPGSSLSIALDCWTSLFGQAFMAITGYFLDQDWNYCEVLLGFEHIQGSHTGTQLSETVIRIFQEHGITDRVLSITTDNASNNNTMVQGVQEMVQSQALHNTSVLRVPCIVHVIQLCLKDLLGKIKANPKNAEAESEWSDERTKSLQSAPGHASGNIVATLKKIRELAVFITASPQRREAFRALQTTEPKLLPIQDVRTRWNYTFLMLERAKKLQRVFNQYCSTHQYVQFQLGQEEWRQVEYLLLVTKPFFHYTKILSKTQDVTVHSVFSIYKELFSHLDDVTELLERKTVSWKKRMLQALQAAKQKLSKYYRATDSESFGTVYAIATILCPSKKLRFFEGDDWKGKNEKGEDINWMETYRDKLQKEFDQYQQRITRHKEPSQAQVSQETDEEELDLMMDLHATLQSEIDRPEDEITRYLAQDLTKGKPRVFWREHEHEYPVLAAMARDNLATPASGAGVERLFNCARDVCHYRRGQLKPETIRSLMLHLFASKFELQQTELEMIKEYLSSGEAAILDQTWKPTPSLNDIEPISENEEDGNQAEDGSDDSENDLGGNHTVEQATPTPVTTQGKQPRRKRPHSAVEPQDDGDNDLPLPEMPAEGSTQGRSGRIRKKPKQPDGFEFDNL
ncbi:hypothetical protein PENANT_c146G01845 [Penicillium antarcticum]|uniref:HAT C-terminal dimerisation domain-containing protein n=1 Tax=Penicillium antarcticum TaxID=416450 RepID=A0A1V6PFM9_9EURO|nr:uncharacterized protein N7508_007325 [Penicillium antarcticum]KAJ5300082.1 hypothetical protein N7508_007325 [Penicillium antarcticum]OQD75851.1 hypothetical protein PENANT_c146G01845 [Penicillium antarcticum]